MKASGAGTPTIHLGVLLTGVHWFLHNTVIPALVLVTQDVFTPITTHPLVFPIVARVAFKLPPPSRGRAGEGVNPLGGGGNQEGNPQPY